MAIQTSATTNNSKFKEEKVPEKKYLEVKQKNRSSASNNEKTDETVIEINPNIIIGIILLVIVGVIAFLVFRTPEPVVTPPATLAESLVDVKSDTNGFSKGKDDAPITIIEYTDFECSYCKMHVTGIDPRTGIRAPTSVFEQIQKEYIDTGIVRYVSKPFSAVPSHNPAFNNELVGTLCAADQDKNKYWDYYDKMFTLSKSDGRGIDNQASSEESLVRVAQDLGLDKDKFVDCYRKRNTGNFNNDVDYVKKEIEPEYDKKKQRLGTPLFVICKSPAAGQNECSGKSFAGAEPFESFKAIIDLVRTNGELTPTATETPKEVK